MNLKTLDLSTLDAVTLKNQSETTCLVLLAFKDGHLDATAASIEEAALFKMQFDELKQSTVLIEEDEGPPVANNPCEICGQVHATEGNPTCVCQFCGQLKEIVHPGGICVDCGRHRYPGQFGGFIPNFHV